MIPKRKKAGETAPERYSPDAYTGLTAKQVSARQAAGLVNTDSAVKTKSVPRILSEHLLTLFNLINIIICAALIYVGSYKSLTFMPVIAANVLIGIIQEIRAKRAVDRLSFAFRTGVTVIRDGAEVTVASEETVLDDIIVLKNGSLAVADCVLVRGECEVNESLVTGESEPCVKRAGDTVLAGSFVSGGECRARADKISGETYISSVSAAAKDIKASKSVLMSSLKRLISVISCIIVPLGALLFIVQLKSYGLNDAVEHTAAALIGMIPQGLMLLTSSALALSVIRLSKKSILVRDLYSIEMMARADVICLDKTGTLTEGKLSFDSLVTADGVNEAEAAEALSLLAGALGRDNATMEAIGAAFAPAGTAVSTVPFSSKTKWSGATFADKSIVLGAAEYLVPGNSDICDKASALAEKHRVLVLAETASPIAFGKTPENTRLLAFVLLNDRIRPEAKDYIAYLVSQGTDIRIISGDSPVTVSAAAEAAGVPGAESYIDCSALKTAEEAAEAAAKYKIFGRVSPYQKKQLVMALKAQGHTVAMTGDGVNDVLAMKEADCSVAMGSGTDAARNVASLVLLKSDFSPLPDAIAEGRRTVGNIQRSASLFLVKTTYAMLMALVFLVLPGTYPFKPIQQSLVAFACIGFPSVVLALEPNRDRISGSFFGSVLLRALPGGIAVTAAAALITCFNDITAYLGSFMNLPWGALPEGELSTVALIVTGVISYAVLALVCYPPTKLAKLLLVTVAVIFTGACFLMGGIFDISSLSEESAFLTVAVSAISVAVLMLTTFISRRAFYAGRRHVK